MPGQDKAGQEASQATPGPLEAYAVPTPTPFFPQAQKTVFRASSSSFMAGELTEKYNVTTVVASGLQKGV